MKCDEQKPACSRCLKSRRRCDGYATDGRRPDHGALQVVHWHPDTLALHRITVDVAGNTEERRAFHFFREKSAVEFPGFFESSFWSQLVLQASHNESSIRHAVIALGSLHENLPPKNSPKERTLTKSGRAPNPFALQQCNKAIGHLKKIFCPGGRHSKELLLMSCAIFICFESLQGNVESALNHILGGLRIFRDWQTRPNIPSLPSQSSAPQSHEYIDSELVQMFSRLNWQMLLFPDTHLFPIDFLKQDVRPAIGSIPDAFTTLKEAKTSLDNCMGCKLQTITSAYFNGQGSEDGPSASRPHEALDQHLLPQWSAAFGAFVEKAGSSLGPKEIQGTMMIEIQYNCLKILLSAGMPPRETAFDACGALFENIISLAASVIRSSGSCGDSDRTSHFSFENGLVPPLYFTATRCRDPCIRRQALSLLSSTPRQEGIWNSEMSSKLAERLILIEEEGETMEQLQSSEVVLLRSRLSVFNVIIDSDKQEVLVECRQDKCGQDEEMCFLNEWITY